MSDNRAPETGILTPLSKSNLTLLCIAFLVTLLILLIESLTDVVVLLAATMLTGYVLLGPVKLIEHALAKFQKNGKPLLPPSLQRTLAIILVYLILAGLLALTVFRLLPPLTLQVQEFIHDIPQYIHRWQHAPRGSGLIPGLTPGLPSGGLRPWLATALSHLVQKMITAYSQYVSQLGGYLLDVGTVALSGFIYLLTMLVLVFILLQDGSKLKKGFIGLMPNRAEHFVSEFLSRFHRHAYQFTKAHALTSLLAGGMIYLLLTLLGNKYALLLGVFYGGVSLIPVVGPWVGLMALLGFVAFGEHPVDILPVSVYLAVFYFLKTYWFWPRLLPRQFDIHPIVFLIMLLACFRVVGLFGVILAFPLASVVGVALDYLQERDNRP